MGKIQKTRQLANSRRTGDGKPRRGDSPVWRIFLICVSVLSIAGCGGNRTNMPDSSFYQRAAGQSAEADEYGTKADRLYERTMDRILSGETDTMEGKDIFDKVGRAVINGYLKAYYTVRGLTPILVVCSLCTGILLMVLAAHNKQLVRMGLFTFILGIPITLLLFTFGIGIANGIFLY